MLLYETRKENKDLEAPHNCEILSIVLNTVNTCRCGIHIYSDMAKANTGKGLMKWMQQVRILPINTKVNNLYLNGSNIS